MEGIDSWADEMDEVGKLLWIAHRQLVSKHCFRRAIVSVMAGLATLTAACSAARRLPGERAAGSGAGDVAAVRHLGPPAAGPPALPAVRRGTGAGRLG